MTEKLLQIANEAEAALAGIFADIDAVSMQNTARVLDAFRNHRVSDAHFAPSSGYGYDDKGRDTLDRIYAGCLRCGGGLCAAQHRQRHACARHRAVCPAPPRRHPLLGCGQALRHAR